MTFLELRRLARRAHLDPAAREILHDALYERFATYRRDVDEAYRLAVENGQAWNVWFFPSALNARTRKAAEYHPYLAFEIHRAYVVRNDLRHRYSDADLNRALVTYHVPAFAYVDPTGTGHGYVHNVETDAVVAQRLGPRSWSESSYPALYERAFEVWVLEKLSTWSRRALMEWLDAYGEPGQVEQARSVVVTSWFYDRDLVNYVMRRVRETGQTPEEIARASRRQSQRT